MFGSLGMPELIILAIIGAPILVAIVIVRLDRRRKERRKNQMRRPAVDKR